MTLATDEFIRRFLIHVLPTGFHRIRHYGMFKPATSVPRTSRGRANCSIHLAPQAETTNPDAANADDPPTLAHPMSVLRRTHDHHRDPPARLLSAHPSRQHNQDRHVMTTIAASRRQTARYLRWFSTRNGRAHSNRHRGAQLALISVVQRR